MATVPFSDTSMAGQARKPAHVAYACAAMGWAAFPLAPGTKRPAITGWKEQSTTSLETLEYWFSGEHQDCSVGIATGEKSDLFVIDVDKKPDVDGFASLRTLLLEHDAPASIFANTITVATPRGGCHIYMKWSHGVVNSAGELGEGIDVRGAGGLVHAAGLDSYQIVPRDGVRRVDVMEAPTWLIELCRKQPKRPVNADGSENQPEGGGHVMGTRRTLENLYQTPSGSRNHELNRAAFRLAVRGELSHDDAWAQCQKVLHAMGAGDGMNDWARTFESGWSNGVAKREGQ